MTIAKKHNVTPSSNTLNWPERTNWLACRPKLGCNLEADNSCTIDTGSASRVVYEHK